MADRPIIMPRLWTKRGNTRQEMSGGTLGVTDASNSFPAGSLVKLASGALAACATSASTSETCSGWSQDASHASTDTPPAAFFGEKHFPMSPRGQRFLMNVSDASGNVGAANSAPQLSAVAVGSSYGIVRPTSGTYSGYQMINSADTTNTLVKVVELPPVIDGISNASTVYNGLAVVEIIDTKIVDV